MLRGTPGQRVVVALLATEASGIFHHAKRPALSFGCPRLAGRARRRWWVLGTAVHGRQRRGGLGASGSSTGNGGGGSGSGSAGGAGSGLAKSGAGSGGSGMAMSGGPGGSGTVTSSGGSGSAASGGGGSGSATSGSGGEVDAGGDTRCTATRDCPAGEICGFPRIPICGTKGLCFHAAQIACLVYTPGCACDGTEINIDCNGLPSGYDTKPLRPAGVCKDDETNADARMSSLAIRLFATRLGCQFVSQRCRIDRGIMRPSRQSGLHDSATNHGLTILRR